MSDDPKDPKKEKKKPYVKPELKRMNTEHPAVVSGAPPVPGATTAATASPVSPGATVF
jgi:hypothetical protein